MPACLKRKLGTPADSQGSRIQAVNKTGLPAAVRVLNQSMYAKTHYEVQGIIPMSTLSSHLQSSTSESKWWDLLKLSWCLASELVLSVTPPSFYGSSATMERHPAFQRREVWNAQRFRDWRARESSDREGGGYRLTVYSVETAHGSVLMLKLHHTHFTVSFMYHLWIIWHLFGLKLITESQFHNSLIKANRHMHQCYEGLSGSYHLEPTCYPSHCIQGGNDLSAVDYVQKLHFCRKFSMKL